MKSLVYNETWSWFYGEKNKFGYQNDAKKSQCQVVARYTKQKRAKPKISKYNNIL